MKKVPATSERDEPSALKLFKQVKKTVGSAIFRAMQVAGKSDDAYPSKMQQQVLSERSGVARSTITKYLRAKDKPELSANPDLKTLCRLADALNVSPAILLLTPEDWSRLAQAAVFLREAASNDQVRKISDGVIERGAGPASRATAGLQLAKLFGVFRDGDQISTMGDGQLEIRKDLLDEQRAAIERQRIGIFVATSIPPLRELQPSLHASILSLCANFGASNSYK